MNAYAFTIPNPFGVCAVAHVATFAENRTAAIRKLKASGVKPPRAAVSSPIKLKDTDLSALSADRDKVWIRALNLHVANRFIDDDSWHSVATFRDLYT